MNAFGIGGLNMHVVIDEFNDAYHRKLSGVRPSAQPARAVERSDWFGCRTNGHDTAHGGRNGESATADDKAIAIIGMGCIFPGAEGLPAFWETLAGGRDPKTAPAEPRWTPMALGQRPAASRYVGGFINDFEYNWRKHKVPPKQVAEADPLQFMFLEAAEQALADAGYDKKPLDRERCGVMVGTEFGGDFCDELEMGLRLPEMKHILADLLARRRVPADTIAQINAQFDDILVKQMAVADRRDRQFHHQHPGLADQQDARPGRRCRGHRQRFDLGPQRIVGLRRHVAVGRQRRDDLCRWPAADGTECVFRAMQNAGLLASAQPR